MSMSRKEFREIAAGIKAALSYADTGRERCAISSVARRVADVCKRSNPAFQYDTFYRACGLNDNGFYIARPQS